jgi:CubicO group peptidase (beta-lactamase class C family)
MLRTITLSLIITSLAYGLPLPQQAGRGRQKRVAAPAADAFFNSKSNEAKRAEVEKVLLRYVRDDCRRPGLDPCTTPGAAVMVIQRDEVVYERYVGAANLEKRVPIDPRTVFDLASVSKQFTAMAVILLRSQGKLKSYDEKLSSFTFPGVKFDPAVADSITVRHLLNHTSGLKDVTTLFAEGPEAHPACLKIHNHYPRSARAFKELGHEPTAVEALKCIAGQGAADLRFPAGQEGRWEYSNAGYIILAQIVESLSGERFRDFLRKNVFEPLRMSQTFVMDETTAANPDRATSYDRGFDEFDDVDYTPLNKIFGDGNVNTNLRDMAKWDRALHVILDRTQYPDETPLVDRSFVAEAFDNQNQTTTHPKINYSAGWFFGFYRDNFGQDKKLMWHSGGWAGFRSMTLRFFESDPRQHLTVILLSNHMRVPPSVVACKIAKIYLRELEGTAPELPLSTEQLRKVVENYHRERDAAPFSDDITLEGEQLWVKDWTPEKYLLTLHASETRRQNSQSDGGAQTFVFYLAGLEGFDIFRYDITGEKITPPPDVKNPQLDPRTQRR